MASPRRAAAMPPEERRQALIAATLPLVLAHGPDVSTRRIAEAAGVAEGTIFRVFPTKKDLVDAVLLSVFDATALVESIGRVDRSLPLADRLVTAVELIQERGRQIADLLHALTGSGSFARQAHDGRLRAHEARVIDALAVLLEPDRGQLCCSGQEAARRLRLVTMALSHPRFAGGEPLPAGEIVAMMLDGIRVHPQPASITSTSTSTSSRPSIGAPSC